MASLAATLPGPQAGVLLTTRARPVRGGTTANPSGLSGAMYEPHMSTRIRRESRPFMDSTCGAMMRLMEGRMRHPQDASSIQIALDQRDVSARYDLTSLCCGALANGSDSSS